MHRFGPVSCFAVVCSLLWSGALTASNAAENDKDRNESKPRPNVLFLLSDDQRPDTIGALGNEHVRTPHLDALVRRGTVFTRAVSAYPLCSPSRAEIMTACSGFRTRMRGNAGMRATGKAQIDMVTWAKTMQNAGYHTWYVGKWHNLGRPSDWGYQECRGLFGYGPDRPPNDILLDWKGRRITGAPHCVFQTEDGRTFPEQGVGSTPAISKKFADAAIGFIRNRPEKPFFMHVNFTAPHDPLLMPPGYQKQYQPDEIPLPPNFLPEHPFDHGSLISRDEEQLPVPHTPEDVSTELAMYYVVINYMDEQIGRILDALETADQAENTLVIFASDHGLAIGSHGLRGKQNLYDHTLGVPLLMAGPGVPNGVRRTTQCYLRDLFPTVCELAGIEVPRGLQGRSLAKALCDESVCVHPYLFASFRDYQRMVRSDRWKLIHYPKIAKYQLFDLAEDPHERNDQAGNPAHADVQNRLRLRLEAWQHEIGDPLALGN